MQIGFVLFCFIVSIIFFTLGWIGRQHSKKKLERKKLLLHGTRVYLQMSYNIPNYSYIHQSISEYFRSHLLLMGIIIIPEKTDYDLFLDLKVEFDKTKAGNTYKDMIIVCSLFNRDNMISYQVVQQDIMTKNYDRVSNSISDAIQNSLLSKESKKLQA